MNGSRHEKAIVMALSYFIGFVTAYIAFGGAHYNEIVYAPLPNTNQTSVSLVEDGTELVMNDVGLFISIAGTERILSANKAAVITSQDEELRQNGFHHKIVDAQLSPDEMFVYFCEQLSEVPTECVPVVFDVEADVAHKVMVDGEYSVEITNHTAAWSPDGLLQVNSFTSAAAETPWM